MVLGWCISFADAILLIFLSTLAAKAEEKKTERNQCPRDIDYVTGQKLPYLRVGNDDFLDPEVGVRVDNIYEDYDFD